MFALISTLCRSNFDTFFPYIRIKEKKMAAVIHIRKIKDKATLNKASLSLAVIHICTCKIAEKRRKNLGANQRKKVTQKFNFNKT